MHRTMQDNIIFSKSIPKLEKEERERKGKEKMQRNAAMTDYLASPPLAASKFEGSPRNGHCKHPRLPFLPDPLALCAHAHAADTLSRPGDTCAEPFEGKRRAGRKGERERERDLLLCSGQHSRLHGDERGPPRPVYAPDLPPSFK